MRLGGGLGGDSRLPKEPRKKILAEAAARGVAAPPAADERPIRYSTQGRGCLTACQQVLPALQSDHKRDCQSLGLLMQQWFTAAA